MRRSLTPYIVEPCGEFEDDPNITDMRFPGIRRTLSAAPEPLRVVGELVEWVGHSPEKLRAMRDGLNTLRRKVAAKIED